MLRALLELPGVMADYTIGTVIVLVQLTLKGRLLDRAERAA
ncbi:MAG TPA: hypothetical protein VIV58_23370 [Kofleriaceae bacterium]